MTIYDLANSVKREDRSGKPAPFLLLLLLNRRDMARDNASERPSDCAKTVQAHGCIYWIGYHSDTDSSVELERNALVDAMLIAWNHTCTFFGVSSAQTATFRIFCGKWENKIDRETLTAAQHFEKRTWSGSTLDRDKTLAAGIKSRRRMLRLRYDDISNLYVIARCLARCPRVHVGERISMFSNTQSNEATLCCSNFPTCYGSYNSYFTIDCTMTKND